MNGRPITVLVIFEALPGKEVEVRHGLMSLISRTRKEVGCINYEMHVSPNSPRKFLLYENWSNKESYYAHLKSQHVMVATPGIEQSCVSHTEVEFWEKIS